MNYQSNSAPPPLQPSACADIDGVDEAELLTSQSTCEDLKSTVSFD
jgi:hypothetical protein